MKIQIVTLGCEKNSVDSEEVALQLKANNIKIVDQKDGLADAIIINTCGFIESAKDQSLSTIFHYINLKKEKKISQICVMGCLSQRYKEELKKELPEVDAFFGTKELPALLSYFNARYDHKLLGKRSLCEGVSHSYVKISDGCNRPCSFCAIPLMKGMHISKPVEIIIKEVKDLVRQGIKEVILIAQDTTYYGLDLYKKRALAELLLRLSDIENLDWIRLHYAYPSGFDMEIIEVMKKRENICNYLDIPLQHIENNVLKLMRRGINSNQIDQLIEKIREKLPEITLRTTFIIGHPGEDKNAFDYLYKKMEELQFDRVGVFPYSAEEGTHADKMEDRVSHKEKEKRMSSLMELQEQISLEKNMKKIDKIEKVLFERVENELFVGRTQADSPQIDNEVFVCAKKHFVRVGDFASIKIKKATSFELYGEPIN